MQLQLFRHLWGVTEPWAVAFPRFRQFGYTGIECPQPADDRIPEFTELLAQHRFDYIAMCFTNGTTPQQHIDSLAKQIDRALPLKPQKICCHSGSDFFTPEQAIEFFTGALKLQEQHKLVIAHETHRQRILFTPFATAFVLTQLPDLKLTADFSHWVCVCERLLNDVMPQVELAARATAHIHARVGYEEGPQVPDPSAEEYRRHLEAHERWWDMIWSFQQQAGESTSTLTPEFGPPGYMHTLPHTNMPVADLWRVCDWQANRQRHRFAMRP